MNVLTNNSSSIETLRCHLTTNKIIYITAYSIIIAAGIIGNSVVLVIFYPFSKRKQTSYNLLIWYLSLFDFIASFLVITEMYEFVTCYKYWPFGLFGCKVLYPFYYISINISIFILTIMTVDRYRKIVTPFKTKLKLKLIHCTVFLSVVFSFLMQWYQFRALHIGNHHCLQHKDLGSYTIPRAMTLLIRDVAFILIFTISTASISVTLVNRKKRMFNHNVTKEIKNRKAMNMLITMGVAFSVLVLPYDTWDCVMLVSRMLPKSYHIQLSWRLEQMDIVLSLLQMCNNIVNCFIYAKMHDRFHKAMRRSCKQTNGMELQRLSSTYSKRTASLKLKPLYYGMGNYV